MVERPADVLQMDPAKPMKFDKFTRADRAIRRMPGLGILIVLYMADHLYTTEHWFGLAVLVLGVSAMLVNEFLP